MKHLIRTTVQTYWEEEIEADSPEVAANSALALVRKAIAVDPDALALCIEVWDEQGYQWRRI